MPPMPKPQSLEEAFMRYEDRLRAVKMAPPVVFRAESKAALEELRAFMRERVPNVKFVA